MAGKDFATPKGPAPFSTPMATPDYNPDKERHIDHTFVVHPSSGMPNQTEIRHGDKTIKLNKDGRAFIKDEGLARELQKEQRFETVVTRMATPSPADRGHRYFFSMPEMPWKRKKNDGEGQEQDIPQDSQTGAGGGLRPGAGSGDCPGDGAQKPPPQEPAA